MIERTLLGYTSKGYRVEDVHQASGRIWRNYYTKSGVLARNVWCDPEGNAINPWFEAKMRGKYGAIVQESPPVQSAARVSAPPRAPVDPVAQARAEGDREGRALVQREAAEIIKAGAVRGLDAKAALDLYCEMGIEGALAEIAEHGACASASAASVYDRRRGETLA